MQCNCTESLHFSAFHDYYLKKTIIQKGMQNAVENGPASTYNCHALDHHYTGHGVLTQCMASWDV